MLVERREFSGCFGSSALARRRGRPPEADPLPQWGYEILIIAVAHELKIRPSVAAFSLEDANKALEAVKNETEDGPAVIIL